MMPMFRKKPVVIDAVQYAPHIYPTMELAQFTAASDAYFDPEKVGIVIPTLEGEMFASPGDWIIKGVKGEFYPCKFDIFEATYEPVKSEEWAALSAALATERARAEAAEAKLAEYKMVASAIDNQWAQEVETVRALTAERDAVAEKLAEVVGLAEEVTAALAQQIGQRRHKSWALIRRATATLADIRAAIHEIPHD